MRGSQQLKLVGASSGTSNINADVTSSSTVWSYFIYRPTDATPATAHTFHVLHSTIDAGHIGQDTVASLEIRTDGKVRAYHGTAMVGTDDVILANGTEIHFWLKYVAGTGANGQLAMYWSANGTRPSLSSACFKSPAYTSGQTCDHTAGTSTANVISVSLREYNNTTGGAYFDSFIVDDAEIGDVCDD
jgi:hypothetical protein